MGAKRSSFFSLLKACFSSGSKYEEGSENGRRIFASDEDRGNWIAEPSIDRKASDFIARYYAARITDSEHQFAS
ncbi:hypothetical protein Lal_00010805 [Lupinus albus]|nr:hypothetical protein Lal_00010805 [Lupinus albus]